jgi:hypothetical protein
MALDLPHLMPTVLHWASGRDLASRRPLFSQLWAVCRTPAQHVHVLRELLVAVAHRTDASARREQLLRRESDWVYTRMEANVVSERDAEAELDAIWAEVRLCERVAEVWGEALRGLEGRLLPAVAEVLAVLEEKATGTESGGPEGWSELEARVEALQGEIEAVARSVERRVGAFMRGKYAEWCRQRNKEQEE